jgi:hypothetical protein
LGFGLRWWMKLCIFCGFKRSKCLNRCFYLWITFIQIYPVGEGYLRKIPVSRTFDCPRNRYFSQITLTNRIYLFNSAEYLIASKTVACKQVQNFRPPRSFDFQSTKTGTIFSKKWLEYSKFKNKINHGFALTYNMLIFFNANEFEIYTFQRFQT